MIDWSKLKFRPKSKTPKISGFDTLIAYGSLLTGALQIGNGITVVDANMKGDRITADMGAKPETMLVLGTKSVVRVDLIEVPVLVANGILNVDTIDVETLSLGTNADVTARIIRYQHLVMAAGSVLSGELRNNYHRATALAAGT
jgi:cytoskeletal protein CcmA (bactofilin family)